MTEEERAKAVFEGDDIEGPSFQDAMPAAAPYAAAAVAATPAPAPAVAASPVPRAGSPSRGGAGGPVSFPWDSRANGAATSPSASMSRPGSAAAAYEAVVRASALSSPRKEESYGGNDLNTSPRGGWQKNETLVKRKIRDAAMDDLYVPTSPSPLPPRSASPTYHFSPASGILRSSGGIGAAATAAAASPVAAARAPSPGGVGSTAAMATSAATAAAAAAAAAAEAASAAYPEPKSVESYLEKYSPKKRTPAEAASSAAAMAAASPLRSPLARSAGVPAPAAPPSRRSDNILFAVLKLLEELDHDSLEVVHTSVLKKLAPA